MREYNSFSSLNHIAEGYLMLGLSVTENGHDPSKSWKVASIYISFFKRKCLSN